MTFRLPPHIAPAAPGPLAHRLDALLPPLGDARLLLVDDDPGQIQQLGRLLAGLGLLQILGDHRRFGGRQGLGRRDSGP